MDMLLDVEGRRISLLKLFLLCLSLLPHLANMKNTFFFLQFMVYHQTMFLKTENKIYM